MIPRRRPFMHSLRVILLLLCTTLGFAVGCSAPPAAPAGLDNVTKFIYREWDNEDPSVMEDGVATLELELKKLDLPSSDIDDRARSLSPMTAEDLATINRPADQDPKNADQNVGVARISKWPIEDHARMQASSDQLPLEPSAKAYTRHFLDPADPACFIDRSCLVMKTDNDVTRKNFFIEVSFLLHKNMRWVKLPGDRWAIVSRSWTDRVFPGNDKDTAILQSYSLDIWLQQPAGDTIRYQALYADTKISVTDRDLILYTVKGATDDVLKKGDEEIGKRLHGEK
jgi:hypothetical protein